MSQNIVISELTQNGYEELYPKTTASQINGVVAEASHSLNSDQLGGIGSNLYATKEYIDGIDPLFAKHKKIVTLSSDNVISFPQIETKKIISIIYRISNFSASITSGKSEESISNLMVKFTKDGSNSSNFLIINGMNAKDIRINTIIQKQAEFASASTSLFLRSASSGGLVFDGFFSNTINGASLEFDNGYFLFRNGNIEVWVRTIDD